MRAFSYACSLPVTWQRWRSHQSIQHCRKPNGACKIRGWMYYRTGDIVDGSFTLCELEYSPSIQLLHDNTPAYIDTNWSVRNSAMVICSNALSIALFRSVALPRFVARRGKDGNCVMGHSRWTSGPGAAAARWLIALWLMQNKELWVVDICTTWSRRQHIL